MVLCHAHAQLDDSFDEEFEVANYNLAQSAQLEAASRMPLQQQNQCYPSSYSHTKMVVPNSTLTQTHLHQNNHSSDPMQIDNLIASSSPSKNPYNGFAPSNNGNRKLKRSCDFECEAAAHHHSDASGSKRVKQVAF
ncbi:hypothetical protein ABW20_dc0104518 [Dactylellina cionopaga]|nr:hypothetical protein ABW20_dc0104518 [Dactylellina cionopaga]